MAALKIESQVHVWGLGKSVDAGAIKWRWTYFSFHINQPNIPKMQKQKRNWKKTPKILQQNPDKINQFRSYTHRML